MNSSIIPQYDEVIRALSTAFDAYGIHGAIIGGVAVGLLAEARFTKDVDALVIFDTRELPGLIECVGRFGFQPMFPTALEFAMSRRVLALRHSASGVRVDILLGCLPFEEELLARASREVHSDFSYLLASPDDLIILKAIAARDQDLADIRAVAEHNPDIDRGRIRHWVEEYGKLLEEPDLWDRIEPLLKGL